MKKYLTLILLGIILVLAAVLAGVLFFMKNHPLEQRAVVQPVSTVADLEPDSELWGVSYPLEYSSWLLTADNKEDTEYGGSSKFSHLERDPRQVILFTGYPFSWEYNDDRGHGNALQDVAARRLPFRNHLGGLKCFWRNAATRRLQYSLTGRARSIVWGHPSSLAYS